MMNVLGRWGTGAAFLAILLAPATAWAHAPSEAARQRMLDGGFLDFVWIGSEHMLTGYDHLLFLLALLLFLSRFRDIVAFVTAFTVGHTLSLLFATPLGITADPYLIDAAIALTIVYKAFENLGGFPGLLKIKSPPLLAMVGLFGLIHGFGLSTRLQEMTLASDPGLVGKLLSFNLGVELGQIAALAAMAFVVKLWREGPAWRPLTRVVNGGLIAVGLTLFGLQLQAYAGARAGAPSFQVSSA